MRTVLVIVPDNDEAESTVRKVAFQLRSGVNVAIVPVPEPLGFDHAMQVAQVIGEAQAKLRVLASVASIAQTR